MWNVRVREVAIALLENSPHRELYLTDAVFKHSFDHFVATILPLFVDGLAAYAASGADQLPEELGVRAVAVFGRTPEEEDG